MFYWLRPLLHNAYWVVGWRWRSHLTFSYQAEGEIWKSARLEAALRVSPNVI